MARNHDKIDKSGKSAETAMAGFATPDKSQHGLPVGSRISISARFLIWINAMTKTVILGREYDQDLKKAVMDVVRQLGASIESRNEAVAGSQEIETIVAEIAGKTIVIEAETYIGLSITGDETVIDRIAERVRSADRPSST